MNLFKNIFGIFMLALLWSLPMQAQQKPAAKKPASDSIPSKEAYLEMKGIVHESKGMLKEDAHPLDSALITIYQGEVPYSEFWTNKKGKCSFKLPLDKNFKIEVSKKGYVTKFFEVNSKVPFEKRNTFTFIFDIDIFEEIKGLDVAALSKPIAKVSYNLISEQFVYDVNYTSRINFDLKKLYKNYYMLQKIEADSVSAGQADSLQHHKKK
jgi:hypothetical protein